MNRVFRYALLAITTAGFVVQLGCSSGSEDEVATPFAISAQPASQTVNVGQRATFSVQTSGPAPLLYRWYKGEDPIPDGTSSSYTTPPTVQLDDGFYFSVEITYPLGGTRSFTTRSAAATLTVLPGFPPAPGTFTATGSMLAARSSHTATPLSNGKVLIAGGFGTSGFLASAELYDPSTGAFTATGSMATARAAHTATLLANGKVLVAGGRSDSLSSTGTRSAELYDPSTGLFTATGSMVDGRSSHTATLLPTGKVLVAGDSISVSPFFTATAELYDPMSGAFTQTGSMTAARGGHSAILLPNGTTFVVGGSTASAATADLYDSGAGSFAAATLAGPVGLGAGAALLPNGNVLIAGGFSPSGGFILNAQKFDPVAGTSTISAALVFVRSAQTATALANGKVLLMGGRGVGRYINRAELYDPVTDTFSVTGGLVAEREGHTATLLSDGRVLIAGGAYGTNLASAVLFTP